jgi:sec-independent protein translocase protein TatC
MTQNNPAEDSGLQESFLSHLFELRDRVIKSALAIIAVFLCLVYWAPEIFHLFAQPLLKALPAGGKMIVTDVTGSFFVPMKVTMLVAFLIALPVVMYQIWAFIAPGLYLHERKLILPLVVSGINDLLVI